MRTASCKAEIIEYIKRNRVSTTEVADCLGKTGAIAGVKPLTRGHFRVGNVFWCSAWEESNWNVHDQIRRSREGDVVLVETFGCGERAVFGDLVTKYIILYRQAAAIVVTGYMRDAHRLVKEGWPVWCIGVTPVGCFNRKPREPLPRTIVRERRKLYDGSIAVCDDTGVVIVPKELQTHDFLEKLVAIEAQEDIWYECVDRRKWSTFDAVCLRKYESGLQLPKSRSRAKQERRVKSPGC